MQPVFSSIQRKIGRLGLRCIENINSGTIQQTSFDAKAHPDVEEEAED